MKRREAEYCRCFKCAEVLVERDGGRFHCDGCGKKIDEVRYTCPKLKQTEDGRTVPRCDVDYCVDCWGEIIEAVKLSLRKVIDDGEMEAASRSGSRSPPGQESRGLRGLSRDDDGSNEEEPLAFSGGGAPRSGGGGPRRAQWSSDDDDDDAALAASSPAHRSTARAPRPRLRPLAPKKNVIYTATGPRSVAFEAESFNVFVWLLPHSKELVAALKRPAPTTRRLRTTPRKSGCGAPFLSSSASPSSPRAAACSATRPRRRPLAGRFDPGKRGLHRLEAAGQRRPHDARPRGGGSAAAARRHGKWQGQRQRQQQPTAGREGTGGDGDALGTDRGGAQ